MEKIYNIGEKQILIGHRFLKVLSVNLNMARGHTARYPIHKAN